MFDRTVCMSLTDNVGNASIIKQFVTVVNLLFLRTEQCNGIKVARAVIMSQLFYKVKITTV